MAKVYGGDKAPGRPGLPARSSGSSTGSCGSIPKREQRWNIYTISLLAFSLVSVLFLYLFQRVQAWLPLANDFANVIPKMAFNTAVSFVTNTNWQSYSGESTMGHLVQMAGLAVQNFVSAAVGMAIAVALIRGLARRRAARSATSGSTSPATTTRILLPIAFVIALVAGRQGVIQNFTTPRRPNRRQTVQVETTDDAGNTVTAPVTEQQIPGGPVASQEAIKDLGTNGGGFFNANSAHPFESPTRLTNLARDLRPARDRVRLPDHLRRDGRQQAPGADRCWPSWSCCGSPPPLLAGLFEQNGNPELTRRGVDQSIAADQGGGNLESKEVRFGRASSGVFAASTTGTSTGSVDSGHDSFTPLGGMVPLVNMKLGEVSPGGVGVGLVGLLINAILAVFIAGLMVGRTPEFLGKKIQAAEMKLVVLYILAMPLAVLLFAGASVLLETALAGRLNAGPHGLTRDPVRLRVGLEQQRLGLRRSHGHEPLVPVDAGPLHARSAASSWPSRCWPSPARWCASRRCRSRPGRSRPTRPLFVGLVLGVILIVAGLTFFPVARPRPHRRAPLPLGTPNVDHAPRSGPAPAGRRLAVAHRAPASCSTRRSPARRSRTASSSSTRVTMIRNPVMFVVEVGSVLTTVLFFRDLGSSTASENVFAGLVSLWLWFTVLFANFAEAMAEGRGKAQAATLRKTRAETMANVRTPGGVVDEAVDRARDR